MWPQVKEHKCKIIRGENARTVVIPNDFFLEGEEIIIRQEKDGVITIFPAENGPKEAMFAKFNPLAGFE